MADAIAIPAPIPHQVAREPARPLPPATQSAVPTSATINHGTERRSVQNASDRTASHAPAHASPSGGEKPLDSPDWRNPSPAPFSALASMASSKRSYALTDLSWPQIADHLTRESRLIVPVGACDQYGPHLPVGAPTVVAEALAQDLSSEFGVLRAPTLPYGVNLPAGRLFAGSATLREKTLHRALNDLLADWEENGFTEFIMITAHAFDPHLESLASVAVSHARVRVINALAIEPPEGSVASGKLEHGGELLTSLLLHLRPHLVRLDSAVDIAPPEPRFPSLSRPRLTRVPDESPGSVGWPSRASRDAGERIYAHVLQKIRDRVFHAEADTHE